LSLVSLLFIVGCKSKSDKTKSDIIDNIEVDMSERKEDKTVKKIFLNLPSPIELTKMLLAANAEFDKELLNPVANVDKYISSGSLALNFGIYGTDLCYCRVFEELQESISYLAAIRNVTDKLQIPEEEGSNTLNRIEESLEDRDSIFQIISDTYAGANSYLKENERDITATLILLGGWVEGMHLATNIKDQLKDNSAVVQRIAEQKYSLENIMLIVEQYKDDASIALMYNELENLSKIYKTVGVSQSKAVVVTDEETGVTTIDNKTQFDISKDQLDEITKLVGQIRVKIVS